MIYLVECYGGEYSDSWSYITKVFKSKESAEAFIESKTSKLSNMLPYEYLWDEICEYLDNNSSYDWDENSDDWDENSETFIKALKEYAPEYLENHTEEFLIALFECFINYNAYDLDNYQIIEMELED